MPLYEYTCLDCQQPLELLVSDPALSPARCGFRCVLSDEDESGRRGFGRLKKCISQVAKSKDAKRWREVPTIADAASVGLSVYKNEGGGRLSKVVGEKGPSYIQVPPL